MMLALLSAIVAIGCILASARRLAWAVAPTSFDAAALTDALAKREAREAPGLSALRDAIRARPDLGWEHDVFDALAEKNPQAREALLEEQLLELDWASRRWARVPRVCASIATSAGFLFGSIALLQGLALPAGDGASPAVGSTLFAALNALAVGIAGTAFCAAVHVRTRRLPGERIAAAERLLERLRADGQDVEPAG